MSLEDDLQVIDKDKLVLATTYLAKNDPIIAKLINIYPLPNITPHSDYYGALVSSIIGQQLSVKAAETILNRFMALFNDQLPTPQQILQKDRTSLREAGLSNSKVNYITDLASKIENNELELDKISKLSNDQIVAELSLVKGIGVWTSHMFLIFCVGRINVLPYGDLGIRKGIMQLYKLATLPVDNEVIELSIQNKWTPYMSIASWYIWRSLDNKNY
jgi:DNA-3-methyladenine glycosylase II